MEPQKKAYPNPQVVDVELEGDETVLLHLETKTYFSLNQTGARIWEALKAGHTPKEIAQMLHEEYEVDLGHAEASVSTLIGTLREQGLVIGAG